MAFPIASAKYPGGTGTAASPAYSGIFIPTIWSGKLIEKFYATTVLAAISNTNYEGEIKKFGDHVTTRQKPTITIRAYQADQELTVDRPSSNVLDLYIDQADYFNTVLDDVMRIQADLNMMDLWAEDASEQMKIKIDTKVLAVFPTGVAAANKGATAGAISGNINLGAAGSPLAIVGRKAGAAQTD